MKIVYNKYVAPVPIAAPTGPIYIANGIVIAMLSIIATAKEISLVLWMFSALIYIELTVKL